MSPPCSRFTQRLAVWGGILALVGMGAVPLAWEPLWEALAPLLARLHPALVHFPIGLLMVAGLLDLTAATFGRTQRSPAAKTCLWLGLLGAAAASGSGWLYAETNPPGRLLEETLFYHRWLGVAATGTAAMSWLLYLMSRGGERSGPRRASRVSLFACLVVTSIGGHLGGEMVYGADFLAEPWQGVLALFDDSAGEPTGSESDPVSGVVGEAEESLAADGLAGQGADAAAAAQLALVAEAEALFADHVLPVFVARCYECHGEEKQKGGLRLDRADGGLYGDAGLIVPGAPDDSVLVQAISLPADDLDIMPAKGDPLSAEEIDAIRRWIEAGAPMPGV